MRWGVGKRFDPDGVVGEAEVIIKGQWGVMDPEATDPVELDCTTVN